MSQPAPLILEPTPASGLNAEQVRSRLLEYGPNELPRPPRRGFARILLGVLSEPMFLLLALAAIIYLAVGGIGEGLLMAAFASLSILLVVVQEKRSENAIEALRALSTPMARVVRGGREQRIDARDVVPGDLLLVASGERVAADGCLRRGESVAADESLLTGESVPVSKHTLAPDEFAAATGDDRDAAMLYASTLVTAGHGLVEVLTTGSRTEAGGIGASLASIEIEQTLLQRSFGRLVRVFASLAVAASVLVVLLYGLLHHDWLQGALSGIALGMSALPEEFPMVLAVFVALGGRRLARLHVLARRTAVIEVLGACSTLCVDKTGTLTENRMRVCALGTHDADRALDGTERTLPESLGTLVRCAARASARTSNDPMDAAVHRLAEATQPPDPLLADRAALVREYDMTHERPAVVRVWRGARHGLHVVAKGAPETIADMCRVPETERARLMARVEQYARRGIRVLALAQCDISPRDLPEDPQALGLVLLGLIAFMDPLRESAREAIAMVRRAGVSVVMITGDHPATALAIAREAGIDCTAPPVTGAQIAAAGDAALCGLVRTSRVFARVRPDQKLRLVRAFKQNGEIVAMTGDGVNDAPALKAANIGLAMGERGTDVAREAAAIVLLEDDLRHLAAGIEMGRRIFDNLRKASIYIAAVHVPISGLTLLPLLLGLPPLLLPMHVVLIEMVIDPICAIAFENEPVEPGTMQQPPRRPDDVLLGWPQLGVAFVQGMLLLAASLGIFVAALHMGMHADVARALTMIGFTAGNLALIRVVATRRITLPRLLSPGHAAYWSVALVAVVVTAACVQVPWLAHLFRFATPALQPALAAIALGLCAAFVFDIAKYHPGVQRILGRSALSPS